MGGTGLSSPWPSCPNISPLTNASCYGWMGITRITSFTKCLRAPYMVGYIVDNISSKSAHENKIDDILANKLSKVVFIYRKGYTTLKANIGWCEKSQDVNENYIYYGRAFGKTKTKIHALSLTVPRDLPIVDLIPSIWSIHKYIWLLWMVNYQQLHLYMRTNTTNNYCSSLESFIWGRGHGHNTQQGIWKC